MVWNLDFDVSAWFVCLLLIIYYIRKKNLPIVRNHSFFAIMFSTMALCTLDIIASVTASFPDRYSSATNYFLNGFYYVILAFCPYTFALFVTVGLQTKRVRFSFIFMQAIPFLIIAFLSITAPWNGIIFTLDEAGIFHYGPGRPLFFYEAAIYYLSSFLYIFLRERHRLRSTHRHSLYFFAFICTFGWWMQMFVSFYHQVIPLCSMIAILLVFLTFQGPDYYRERITGFFDSRGLELVLNEQLKAEHYSPFVGFIIENYLALKTAYSDELVTALLRQISDYIRSVSTTQTTFYLRNGIFLALLSKNDDPIKLRNLIMDRVKKPFYVNNNEYILRPYFFYNSGDIHYANYNECRLTIQIAIEQALATDDIPSVAIDESMYQTAIRTFEVEQAVDYALRNKTVEVYYQPIFSTRSNRIVSAEALARIKDPNLGLVMPDEFIPIAEHRGSIFQLGEQVFEKVCQFIRDNDMDALGIEYIEVNLSPLQINRSTTAEHYIKILEEYQVDPSRINLEITETSTTDSEFAYENIRKLSAYGVRFSLDDYGTGYSNLINTITLPYSIIKLDKSIVQAYLTTNSQLLQQMIYQFTILQKQVVAEGVENNDMAHELTDLGCQYLQGYFYSKPIPADDFLQYMTKQS